MEITTKATEPGAEPTAERVRLPLSRAVAIGVVTVIAAVAAGHLVAGLINPAASPVIAVGNSVRDLTPPAVTEWAIANLGDVKKPLVFVGLGIALLVAGAIAGLVSRRRPWPGMGIAAAIGIVGLVSVADQATVSGFDLLAPVLSMLTGVGVFLLLHRVARGQGGASEAQTAGSNRRRFLWTTGGVAVGAAAFGAVGQFLATLRDAESSRAAIGTLTPSTPAPPVPAGADFARQGTPRFLTSNRDFYRVDTELLSVPQVRAEDWLLRVHGLVDNTKTFTFNDIRNRPLVERTITMTCVSNEVGGPYISTANFIGVPLRDLLDEAGVRAGADQLFSSSVDGWTAGSPVDAAMDRNRGALLAIGMNGEPLPVEHGFPARMVIPGLYGFVSATKWVVDMELTTFAARESYWRKRGWGIKAPIKTQSRIDAPRGFATLPPGKVTIAGVAWAQTVGIDKVEVRLNGGNWQEAELTTEVNTQTWRMWRLNVNLAPGSYKAEVRATDRRGNTQPADRVPPIPDGATGWHSTDFTVSR
ncbi:molybdopterin-dependent oxidoreductase [Labedaea rhizosphaerae]|uniref:DMSO/TMAO reductase YedYZ molybdopterin-dependent catalytic subunit n=1 Tax=Labedaea rhizosphaerae TaxID=598644 RepID=A0A4R6RYC6_LABRH|nr:molybdopterin-dependent oxidoreductase [Labedaea rhizosphaerae]TDP91864.1 DMSO/TMAO reductase YedYZ molybdopterin-dependent catalytic subunit [Labedaea rhizosphaerae]